MVACGPIAPVAVDISTYRTMRNARVGRQDELGPHLPPPFFWREALTDVVPRHHDIIPDDSKPNY